ncbi:MAG: GNAT family N-acetyltransferase [Dehalococcoidales bacterium]
MEQIVIEPAQPREILEASVLLSRAFATNPIQLTVFQGRRRAIETSFRTMLGRFPGQVLLAKESGQTIGVMRMVEWPRCQVSPLQILTVLPSVLNALRGTLPRVLRFNSIWAKHDPKQPHWHFGPIGVLPERQGQGIGSQLLEHFCKHVDQLGEAAYLETDKPENVRLYERFGFSVSGETPVFGVPTWFMWRPPTRGRSAVRTNIRGSQ